MHTSAAAKKYIGSFLTNRTTTLVLCTYEDKSPATLSPIIILFFASTPLPQLNAGPRSNGRNRLCGRHQHPDLQLIYRSGLSGSRKSIRKVHRPGHVVTVRLSPLRRVSWCTSSPAGQRSSTCKPPYGYTSSKTVQFPSWGSSGST
jgi:hypothetical protein